MGTIPDEATIRAWLNLSDSSMTVTELEAVRAGELANQLRVCRIPGCPDYIEDDYPDDLVMALLRRCGRAVAARGVPLGVVGSDEYGPSRLPAFDAEIERYERPHRRVVFG